MNYFKVLVLLVLFASCMEISVGRPLFTPKNNLFGALTPNYGSFVTNPGKLIQWHPLGCCNLWMIDCKFMEILFYRIRSDGQEETRGRAKTCHLRAFLWKMFSLSNNRTLESRDYVFHWSRNKLWRPDLAQLVTTDILFIARTV